MALVFRQLFDSTSSTYTYLLGDTESGEAVYIDAVFEKHARDVSLVRELGLKLTHALETHVHADHVTGAWLLREALGAQIGLGARSGAKGADLLLSEGDEVRFGDHRLQIRETPGHTDGCVTYVLDGGAMAFTGDALLIRGAGRTDFQQGSAERLYRSIHDKIFSLPESCAIYPGHDYAGRTASSVREEKQHNPRAGGDRNQNDFVGFMNNLNLPHPKQLDIAVPANLVCGRPEDGTVPRAADWGPVVATYGGIKEIDPEWVAQNLDRVQIVDVREADEVALGMIDGALHIPLGSLSARAGEIPRDRPVITVCRSGGRSAQAVNLLAKAGLADTANLAGGMLRWASLTAQRHETSDF